MYVVCTWREFYSIFFRLHVFVRVFVCACVCWEESTPPRLLGDVGQSGAYVLSTKMYTSMCFNRMGENWGSDAVVCFFALFALLFYCVLMYVCMRVTATLSSRCWAPGAYVLNI